MAIRSFADPVAQGFFQTARAGKRTPWANIAPVVRRKLDMLHYAARLEDLESPPGNRLEALKGDLKGFHSIRINDQWRVVFRWTELGPEKVQVADYHS